MAKKILIVDDSSTVRQTVALALSNAGYDSIEAGDGVDGLQRLEQNTEVALVICDVNMPKKNGIEMLLSMRADARHAAVPVVMLTTEGNPDLMEQARRAGAKGWLVKPFKTESLVATVKKLAGPP
jgi:two-component system, chemotaxis family, chemotaxis protein CheY